MSTIERGRKVSRILAVDAPAAGIGVDIHGTVKFYDTAKGYGFIVPDDARRGVFVHASALSRSSLDQLLPGQRVSVRAEEAPRDLQATEMELL